MSPSSQTDCVLSKASICINPSSYIWFRSGTSLMVCLIQMISCKKHFVTPRCNCVWGSLCNDDYIFVNCPFICPFCVWFLSTKSMMINELKNNHLWYDFLIISSVSVIKGLLAGNDSLLFSLVIIIEFLSAVIIPIFVISWASVYIRKVLVDGDLYSSVESAQKYVMLYALESFSFFSAVVSIR